MRQEFAETSRRLRGQPLQDVSEVSVWVVTGELGGLPAQSEPTNSQFRRLCMAVHKRKNYLFAGSDAGGIPRRALTA
jgi:hypothetical protein